MAHARRKFNELHVTGKSQIAEQALLMIQKLYAIEAELRKKTDTTTEQRSKYRQQHSQPVMQYVRMAQPTSSDGALKFSHC